MGLLQQGQEIRELTSRRFVLCKELEEDTSMYCE